MRIKKAIVDQIKESKALTVKWIFGKTTFFESIPCMINPSTHEANFDDTFSSAITVNYDEANQKVQSHKTRLELSFTDSEELIGVADFDLSKYITKIQDDSFAAKFKLGDLGNPEGNRVGQYGKYPNSEVHLHIDVKFTNTGQ